MGGRGLETKKIACDPTKKSRIGREGNPVVDEACSSPLVNFSLGYEACKLVYNGYRIRIKGYSRFSRGFWSSCEYVIHSHIENSCARQMVL